MGAVDRVVIRFGVLRQTSEWSGHPFDDELRFLRNDRARALRISDFDELVCSISMSGEVVVRSEESGREYSVRSLLASIFDGPRSIASQPEWDASLLMFKDGDFTLLPGVELGGRLPSTLDLTGAPNVGHKP